MRSRPTADGAPGCRDKREPPSRQGVWALPHLGGATRHPLDSGQAGRSGSRTSTLIRHAGPPLPFAVGSLAVPMIEFSFRAALVPTVGLTQLSTAVALPAQHATVAGRSTILAGAERTQGLDSGSSRISGKKERPGMKSMSLHEQWNIEFHPGGRQGPGHKLERFLGKVLSESNLGLCQPGSGPVVRHVLRKYPSRSTSTLPSLI